MITTDPIVSALRSDKARFTLVGVWSACAGAVVGYKFAVNRLDKKVENEVSELKAYYEKFYKDKYAVLLKEGEYSNVVKLAEKYNEIVDTEGYSSETKHSRTERPDDGTDSDNPEELIAHSVWDREEELDEDDQIELVKAKFDSDEEGSYFDYEEELARREAKPEVPYVITLDEFNQGEREFETVTLTYFDGDDVLADADDSIVPDIAGIVGYENLLRFGHGSNDPNIVYIRNEKNSLDIELIQSKGKYSKEVLGFIEHSEKRHRNRRPVRKFRAYDE